jgi:hypothetical protein
MGVGVLLRDRPVAALAGVAAVVVYTPFLLFVASEIIKFSITLKSSSLDIILLLR